MPKYVNLDGTVPDKGLGDVLKWQVFDRLTGKRRAERPGYATPRRDNDGGALRVPTPHLTWIGHASFALRLGGALVGTDPVFAARMGPRRRLTAPGVTLENLPALDLVTVSHAHYDHMD